MPSHQPCSPSLHYIARITIPTLPYTATHAALSLRSPTLQRMRHHPYTHRRRVDAPRSVFSDSSGPSVMVPRLSVTVQGKPWNQRGIPSLLLSAVPFRSPWKHLRESVSGRGWVLGGCVDWNVGEGGLLVLQLSVGRIMGQGTGIAHADGPWCPAMVPSGSWRKAGGPMTVAQNKEEASRRKRKQ